MSNKIKPPFWFPKLADSGYIERLRKDYPEHAQLTDGELLEYFNRGLKYVITWDHVGDAYENYAPLADDYLLRRKKQEKLLEMCEAMIAEVVKIMADQPFPRLFQQFCTVVAELRTNEEGETDE